MSENVYYYNVEIILFLTLWLQIRIWMVVHGCFGPKVLFNLMTNSSFWLYVQKVTMNLKREIRMMPILYRWASTVQWGNLLSFSLTFFLLLSVNVVQYFKIFFRILFDQFLNQEIQFTFWANFYKNKNSFFLNFSAKKGDYFLLITETAPHAKGIKGLKYERSRSNSLVGSFDIILTRRKSRSNSLAVPSQSRGLFA